MGETFRMEERRKNRKKPTNRLESRVCKKKKNQGSTNEEKSLLALVKKKASSEKGIGYGARYVGKATGIICRREKGGGPHLGNKNSQRRTRVERKTKADNIGEGEETWYIIFSDPEKKPRSVPPHIKGIGCKRREKASPKRGGKKDDLILIFKRAAAKRRGSQAWWSREGGSKTRKRGKTTAY